MKHRVTLTLSVIPEKILLDSRGYYELRNYIMELVPPGDLRMGRMLAYIYFCCRNVLKGNTLKFMQYFNVHLQTLPSK
jgi:hypothetical protein